MSEQPAPNAFTVTADAYDDVMGRYSMQLAEPFARFAQVIHGRRALDVGCGPGALTGEFVRRLGVEAVAACDPSPQFVAACADRHPGVDVRVGSAAALPFGDRAFDVVAAQLVMQFVPDLPAAAAEFRRVAAQGATVAACVWDSGERMQLFAAVFGAVAALDHSTPPAAALGAPGALAQWLTDAGLREVTEAALTVRNTYHDFDELWSGLTSSVGAPGRLGDAMRAITRDELRALVHERLGSPSGAFALSATAHAARGTIG